MYWKLFVEKWERVFSRRRRRMLRRGAIGLLLVVAGLLLADYGKGRGNDSGSKNSLISPQREALYGPGGQETVVLSRSALPDDPSPELLSVTLLPGRGMDVLQMTAHLPGKGEVKLLASSDPAGAMTGTDLAAETNLARGAAFLMPWAGRLGGTRGADGKSAAFGWRGRTFEVPAQVVEDGSPVAYGGLLRQAKASSVDVKPMPDGGAVTATFASEGFGGRWPSKTEMTIAALLASKALELSVVVKNIGDEATPVGVGWAPRFVVPSGQRERARLRIPASLREVIGQGKGEMPTGELDPVKGTAYDFNVPGGMELGSHGLNDTFTHLSAGFEAHPVVELRDPEARFGLRISLLSPAIKAVHVFSPANSNFVEILPQMNYDDPFSRKWPKGEDTGMAVLGPGQTVEWKVRVELVAILPGQLKVE